MTAPTPLVASLTHAGLHLHGLAQPSALPLPFELPPSPTTSLLIFPDSTRLAEGLSCGTVRLRDLPTLRATTTLAPPHKPQAQLEIQPEIPTQTQPALRTFNTPTSSSPRVTALAASQSGHLLASGRHDGTVVLHDVLNAALCTTLAAEHDGPVLTLAFPPVAQRPRHLASVTAHSVALFSTASFRRLARLRLPSAPPRASSSSHSHSRSSSRSSAAAPVVAKLTGAAFSPLHPRLLAATDDTGGVTVWDVAKHVTMRARSSATGRSGINSVAKPPPPPPPPPPPSDKAPHARFVATLRAPATSLSFAPDGTLLVAGFDKHVRVFEPGLTRLLFTTPAAAPISALACGRDGRDVALGLTDGSVALAKLDVTAKTLRVVQRIRLHAPDESAPLSQVVRAVALCVPRPSSAERRRARRQATPPQQLHSGVAGRGQNIPVTPKAAARTYPPPGAAPTVDNLDDVLVLLSTSTRGAAPLASCTGADGGGADDTMLFSPIAKRSETPPLSVSPPSMPSLGAEQLAPPPTKPRPRRARTAEAVPTASQVASRAGRVLVAGDFANCTVNHETASPVSSDVSDETGDGECSPNSRGEVVGVGVGVGGGGGGQGGIPTASRHSSSHSQLVNAFLTGVTQPEFCGIDMPPLRKALPRKPSSRLDTGGVRNPVDTSPRRVRIAETERREPTGSISERGPPLCTPVGSCASDHGTGDVGRETQARSADFCAGGVAPVWRRGALRDDRIGDPLAAAAMMSTARHELAFAAEDRWTGSDLARMMREIVKSAVDELRTDLRSDILAIHSEMVIMEARHSEELRTIMVERDEGMGRMYNEVVRLRQDNERMRAMYSLR